VEKIALSAKAPLGLDAGGFQPRAREPVPEILGSPRELVPVRGDRADEE
jgi:hypothetical protein